MERSDQAGLGEGASGAGHNRRGGSAAWDEGQLLFPELRIYSECLDLQCTSHD